MRSIIMQTIWQLCAVKPLYPNTCIDQPLPYIDHFIWVPNGHPYNTIVIILYHHKLTTSLNRPFKVDLMLVPIREILLYINRAIMGPTLKMVHLGRCLV